MISNHVLGAYVKRFLPAWLVILAIAAGFMFFSASNAHAANVECYWSRDGNVHFSPALGVYYQYRYTSGHWRYFNIAYPGWGWTPHSAWC